MREVRDNTNRPENKIPLSPREITDIKQLHAVIEEETKKPKKEQDAHLIDECIGAIAQIQGVRAAFTPEELEAQAAAIQTGAGAERSAAARRPKRRRIGLLAACLAVVMLTCAVTSYAVSPAVRNWIQEALKLPVGTSTHEGNVTYSHGDKFEVYDSLEEVFAAENINLFYPTALPKHIRVKSVLYLDINGTPCYSIGFTTKEFTIIVQIGYAQALSPSAGREPYINEIGTFYISDKDGITAVAGIIGDDLYNFTMKNSLNVKEILDSLKTVTP